MCIHGTTEISMANNGITRSDHFAQITKFIEADGKSVMPKLRICNFRFNRYFYGSRVIARCRQGRVVCRQTAYTCFASQTPVAAFKLCGHLNLGNLLLVANRVEEYRCRYSCEGRLSFVRLTFTP